MSSVLSRAAQAHLKPDDLTSMAPAGVNIDLVKQILAQQNAAAEIEKATVYATGVTRLINISQETRIKMVAELRSLRAQETRLTKLLKDVTEAENYACESSNPVPLLQLLVGKCQLKDQALEILLDPKDLKELAKIKKPART
jgi:hypothetical protein